MKDKATLLAGAALAVWILGGMTSALAQGPPPGGGGPGGGGPPPGGGGPGGGRPPGGGPGGVRGELPDLGKAADRFQAWKIAKIGGAESFSKYEVEVREKYQGLIEKIKKATIEDRLDGKKARGFIVKALGINNGSAKGGGTVESKLKALEAEVDGALTDSANAETLTPSLNQLQWLIGETLIYGSKTKELSAAKVNSINKKLIALEEKEAKAKKDGKLTNLERKRLDEGAMKIWELIVKGLKGRND